MMTLNSKGSTNEHLLKIAIVPYRELEQTLKKDIPPWILYTYNPQHDLNSILESVAISFQWDNAVDEYALILTEKSGVPYPHYITEENRNEIVNGALVQVYYSPKRFVIKLLEKFRSLDEAEERLNLLKDILNHSNDPAFVAEFDAQQGLKWLMSALQSKEFTSNDELCCALEIFLKTMEHDIVHWTSIDKQFIDSVAHNIYNRADFSQIGNEERKILITSLSILEASVINCPGKFVQEIERQITLPNLNNLLKNEKFPQIQQNVLALINAILQRTDANKKRAMAATLSSRQFKDTILQYVVNKKNPESEKSTCGSEITHQLYVLQTHLLHFYDDKRLSGAPFDEARDKVKEIRSIYAMTMERDGIDNKANSQNLFRSQTSLASNSSGASNGSTVEKSHAEDYERFGFGNIIHPWEYFYDPPGALVLDSLHFFAKSHTDDFVRFVIENSSFGDRQHDCPLVIAASELVRILVDLLGMSNAPRDEGKEFYPMLFDGERPFEELFSIGLNLFNRTWHEIHATSADMMIVENFLKEKLRKTLSNANVTNSFDSFKKEVMKISYSEINRRWNEERDKRDRQKEELPVIKELKALLKPEMVDIVRQHRLNSLIRGTRFDKYTPKGQRVKDKFWYCRLSSNHKSLVFGDCDEDCKNLDDILVNKFNIADIEQIITGKDCPHMRDTKGKKSTTSLAFALISREDSVRNLCFVAPNSETFDCWVDGLNALIDRQMVSQEAEKDAEMLLELDIKLRLLDIEGINIPEKAPEIPPSPPNYEFSYKPTLIP